MYDQFPASGDGLPLIAIPRVAMRWIPDEKRKRGRPKETWRQSVERGQMKMKGRSWGEVVKLAKDKQQWHSLVTASCAGTHEEN